METTNTPAAKRMKIAMGLGVLSGLLCLFLAAQQEPALASISNPIAWTILTDRILIGLVVGLAGAFTIHPALGFPYPPWLRGGCMGTVVSLPLATGAISGPPAPGMSAWMLFSATLVTGAIYGTVIDLIATRFGGEGYALLHEADRRP